MHRNKLAWLIAVALMAGWGSAAAGETPRGQGMTEANKERLVLDDMEDISDWYNGSPDETIISASPRHVKQGETALRFANLVDHTKGEKNYPVGWPRAGKDLVSSNLTDWSGYDMFECWIRVQTSREALPKTPLGVGFYHTGHKRSSSFRLEDVRKDAWVRVSIPIDRLSDPKDVRRVQFNITESNYKHGDQVDFYIDDLVLTRFVEPAIAQASLSRTILYSHDRRLVAHYKLVGYKNLDTTRVALTIGRGDAPPLASVTDIAAREGENEGEIVLPIEKPLTAGSWRVSLCLEDAQGNRIDRKQLELRVVTGPFEEN